ncbi:hypothetical protein DET48_12350 [Vibrio diazotrophicus]|jgi:hypothetical protein|uniref:Uncharacterized protein n=1 Tax=Vibrio diazotrophicus TaxID=685 RepID=A0A329E5K8_VIBDI|nr:hypothetical protein [Vibrio diazotrophicus]RAS60079.1 hypothetical protein DET48_12350 [Vibrio diazotrophicus]
MRTNNLDSINTLNKLIAQTSSLVAALSEEENLNVMPAESIGNSLWLVSDQLERMGTAINELKESIQGKGGKA